MAEQYTVIRTDLMSGTIQSADLVSLRFYGGDNNPAQVENGTIVRLTELESGEREVWKAVAAASSDDLDECAVVAGVEVMYDERKKNLDEYINEAGKAVRGYRLRGQNIWSITAKGFVGESVPAVGGNVGVGTDGKVDASGSGLGKCIAVEKAGRYTYYVLKNTKKATT